MTTTETPLMAATRRGQEAYWQFWTDVMHRFFGMFPIRDGKPSGTTDAEAPSVPTAEKVVDDAFDCADAMLDIQRAYFKGMLAVNKSVSTSAAWMPQGEEKATTS
ncbi:MAG TPA: hypothetical protein VFO16_02875 [Pseudonocardiaceae bacterium]|nr:hypothetical protein [Pseudonocardiaceae bacterium]